MTGLQPGPQLDELTVEAVREIFAERIGERTGLDGIAAAGAVLFFLSMPASGKPAQGTTGHTLVASPAGIAGTF